VTTPNANLAFDGNFSNMGFCQTRAMLTFENTLKTFNNPINTGVFAVCDDGEIRAGTTNGAAAWVNKGNCNSIQTFQVDNNGTINTKDLGTGVTGGLQWFPGPVNSHQCLNGGVYR